MKGTCTIVYKSIEMVSRLEHKPIFPRFEQIAILQIPISRAILDYSVFLTILRVFLVCQREELCSERFLRSMSMESSILYIASCIGFHL